MAASFIERAVEPAFERRTIVVGAGCERPYDEAEWVGAIVVLERGAIELECVSGGSRRFGAGDILWLVGLALRALRNPGEEPTVLIAVSRARTDEFSGREPFKEP